MTYHQTLAFLFSKLPMYQRIGAAAYKDNLENSIALDKLLQYPHRSFKSIHVAGTNGKGSTSNMLAAILQSEGYTTGLFTSPHLKDFRERIRVNGKMISKRYVITFVEKYKHIFEIIQPSFFEWTVALAFDYFRHKKVRIAVVETGLGGRLDSTNIITPLLSVITNIGWDHTALLGNTLKKIAHEKAGIIKPDVPVVIGESQQSIKAVFTNKAKTLKSAIFFADKQFRIEVCRQKINKLTVNAYNNKTMVYENLISNLAGEYQLKNIATVLATIDVLKNLKFKIKHDSVVVGLKNVEVLTGFKGRWQMLQKKPFTIADTGHNVDGIINVIRQIKNLRFKHLHVVFGMVADKDVNPILKLLPVDATYYFCQAKIPRALDAKTLKNNALQHGLQGKTYSSVKAALRSAKKQAKPNDFIFIGGSSFIVAEIV